jgi:hypothetical protein
MTGHLWDWEIWTFGKVGLCFAVSFGLWLCANATRVVRRGPELVYYAILYSMLTWEHPFTTGTGLVESMEPLRRSSLLFRVLNFYHSFVELHVFGLVFYVLLDLGHMCLSSVYFFRFNSPVKIRRKST